MDNFVNISPTQVRVGHSTFEVYRRQDSVLQMIGKVVLVDPASGEKLIVNTPTPGWDFKLLETQSPAG